MDKLKKVFSPGSSKDDEILYGSEETRLQNAPENEAKKDTSTLYPVEGQQTEQGEKGGVLRQILNPGGKKYDEQAMGTTATTEQPGSSKLQTDTRQRESPAYTTTTTTGQGASTGDSYTGASNTQSNLTPADPKTAQEAAVAGGDLSAGGAAATAYSRRDNETTGVSQTDGLADNRTGTQAAQDQSGAHGPGRDAGEANFANREHDNDPDKGKTILAATGTTSQSRPLGESDSSGLGGQTSSLGDNTSKGVAAQDFESTSGGYGTGSTRTGGITDSADTTFTGGQSTTESSNLGRNAGIAGGLAAAGAGGAAYAASRDNNNSNTFSSTDNSQSLGDRSHPLTSGAGHGHINPVAAPEASLRETTSQSAPRDSQLSSSHAGVLGSSEPATGVAAGGIRNDEGVTQLNKAPADVQGATFLDRSFYVGKSGDTVDHGPNVAGQFLGAETTSTGASLPATAAAGAGVGAIGAGSALGGHSSSTTGTAASPGIQTTTNTTERVSASARHGSISGTDHNPDSSTTHTSGRDAAIAGGAGAAGVAGAGAAYAATRDSDPTTHAAYGADDPNKHNKLHKPSPEDKKLEKEHAKEEKHHQKEVEKQQRELEKEQEKKQRELEKQHEKDEKERRHAAEKAEKKHEKELEKEEKDKKPGLISRILHRNKDDKDDETKEATALKENKDNGPLDHPLITPAGTTAVVGGAGAAGAYAGRDSAPGQTREATGLKENKDNGPLDHPLITAAGTTTAAGGAGAAGAYATRDTAPGESGNLTGQRQHDVEPALSGNNNTIGGPGAVSTTTSQPTTTLPRDDTTATSSPSGAQYAAASGGALGAAAGAGALASASGTGNTTSDRDAGLTGQRQHDVEPLLSGNNNAIGSTTTTTTTTTTSSSQPQADPKQYSSRFSEDTGAGGASAAAAAPVLVVGGSTTTGDYSRVGASGDSATGTTSSHKPGEGLTGRRQDDVDPYISGGGFSTSK
ncbi:unnamed protein product [Cercospora beticola]|nr:unnamed protein product [Cercospora beticola]